MADRCKYKTLVFLGVETTGLPPNRPEIIEISLVACSVDHFISTRVHQLPRVQHKLTLCFNPGKIITPEAANMTGLTNTLLEADNYLGGWSLKLVFNFFRRLQQPICLVSHNGDRFEFPIITKYCTQNEVFYPVDCVDSLGLFKRIEKEEDHKFNEFLKSELSELLYEPPTPETTVIENEPTDVIEEISTQALELTPDNNHYQTMQSINETTPLKRPTPYKKIPRMFMDQKSFKLISIYKRYYRPLKEPCDRRTDKAIILFKCALACKQHFITNIPHFVKQLENFVC